MSAQSASKTIGLVACLPFLSPLPALSCDLSNLKSAKPFSSSFDFNGQQTPYTATPSWNFVSSDSSVRITEKIEFLVPNLGDKIAAKARSSANLPHDDCDVNATIDSQSVATVSGNLVIRFQYSANKWTCPGMHVPCPTFTKPLRFCYKHAQTIVGGGAGHYDLTMHPDFQSNDVSLITTPNQEFHLKSGSSFLVSFLFGPFSNLVKNSVEKLARIDVDYPPVTIPASEGTNEADIQLQWRNSKVYFDTVNGVVELVRERYVDVLSPAACFARKTIESLAFQ